MATSSLELGIDMGAVDLVIQVESPKSVTAGLQRIGRAGHGVGEVSRGRIFPKFRADLLECAVVAKRMRDGDIEPTVVPRNPLDVLAQQIVAMTASGDELKVPALHETVRRAYPFAELSRELLDSVLDMLDGRYPSEEFAELRPRIVWDRVEDTIRARRGALQLAVTNAGTIPDRGLYGVHLPDGRRVGELDEEMVYEARPGQTFLLGASTWRIEEITRDRVIVTPAPGRARRRAVLEGRRHRPPEGARPRDRRVRARVRGPRARRSWPPSTTSTSARRSNLSAFLREQRDATRVVPSDRTIVVERFRDEIGDWRLCVLSPFGGRVHSAWALALSARIRDEFGLESDAIWSDDGIIVHLPDADEPPSADLLMVEPDAIEDMVVRELSGSALFGARFRENAARALLLPRAYPGKRTPLWQQRLKAQSLLEVAKRYGQFPIVLETYRECLQDVLDLPGLEQLLRGLHTRELSLVEVETQRASPFASSLLFDYVATYMYEGDTPNAERRAAALSLDRDLLRELLGQEELRELIDPGALEEVEADLQRTSERTRAANSDGLHDVLRAVGDLTADEAQARCLPAVGAARILGELEKERRAVRMRIGGEERWIASEDAGLYRDALGAVPPGGLPAVFLEEVEEPLPRLARRYARTHGPFTTREMSDRYGLDLGPVLRELERGGDLVRGELRPGGSEREWCDPDVLRRLRRASLATLRKEVEPAEQRALARFLPAWQGVDGAPPGGAGVDRLREMLVPLQGLALAPEVWERDVLPRRVGAYSPGWMDQLCASGELVWVGAGAVGRSSGRVALLFREDARWLGPPPFKGERPGGAAPRRDPRAARARRGVLDRPAGGPRRRRAGGASGGALGPRLGGRGHERRLRAAARAAALGREGRPPGRAPLRAPPPPGRAAGAGPLVAHRAAVRRRARARPAHARDLGAAARAPRDRDPRGGARRGRAGRLRRRSTPSSRTSRRSARRGAATSSRGSAAPSSRCPRRSSGCAACARTSPPGRWCWPPPTRRTRTAPRCRGRRREDDDSGRRPSRVPGAYVVTLDAEPVLYVERGGKGLLALREPDEDWLRPALEALAEEVRRGRVPRLGVERFDGEPVVGSEAGALLIELGFRQGPRRLTPERLSPPKSGDSPRFFAGSRGVASIAQCRATSIDGYLPRSRARRADRADRSPARGGGGADGRGDAGAPRALQLPSRPTSSSCTSSRRSPPRRPARPPGARASRRSASSRRCPCNDNPRRSVQHERTPDTHRTHRVRGDRGRLRRRRREHQEQGQGEARQTSPRATRSSRRTRTT